MLPDLSVLFVIAFVLLLTVVLQQLFFKPLLRVIHAREDAVQSARALAERSAAEARRASEEFDARTTAARATFYRELDDMRKQGQDERAAMVAPPGTRPTRNSSRRGSRWPPRPRRRVRNSSTTHSNSVTSWPTAWPAGPADGDDDDDGYEGTTKIAPVRPGGAPRLRWPGSRRLLRRRHAPAPAAHAPAPTTQAPATPTTAPGHDAPATPATHDAPAPAATHAPSTADHAAAGITRPLLPVTTEPPRRTRPPPASTASRTPRASG